MKPRIKRTHSGKLNFHTSIWGNSAWDFLHIVALSYPNLPTFADKQNYTKFFNSLGPVLPCHKCTENYANHLNKYPIKQYLGSPEKLFYWTVLIRNVVRRNVLIDQGKDPNQAKYIDAAELQKFYCDKQNLVVGTGLNIAGINRNFGANPAAITKIIFVLIGGGIIAMLLLR